MRDLYHRKERLEYWINRVNTDLKESDRSDVLKLVEHMQDRERSILWIIRCITALLTIRKQLGKSFREVTKDDIRSFLKWMDERKYKASTNEKFRQVLKLFYKIVYVILSTIFFSSVLPFASPNVVVHIPSSAQVLVHSSIFLESIARLYLVINS